MTPITRLGLLANLTRPRAHEGLDVLRAAAKLAGITLLAPPDELPPYSGFESCPAEAFQQAGAQGVISLGGDGTLLAAAHRLAPNPLPLIGLNIGNLGYLTAVNEEGFYGTLRSLASGQYTLETRTTLAVSTSTAPEETLPDALNDLVISRAEGGHAFALLLELDGSPVARYLCDGLILATPTGSTAYSLSVGGPVMAPAARAFVISVIAPHALTARPLVIPDTTRVTVRIAPEGTTSANLYSDGTHIATLHAGESFTANASPRPVQLIIPAGHNPYAPLSQKLGWGAAFTR